MLIDFLEIQIKFAQHLVGNIPREKEEKKKQEEKSETECLCMTEYLFLFAQFKCPHCDVLLLLINIGLDYHPPVSASHFSNFAIF